MKRLPVFVALPRASLRQVLEVIYPPANVIGPRGGLWRATIPAGHIHFLELVPSFEIPAKPSDAPSGKWRLYAFQSLGDVWPATRAYRWLGRRRQSHPGEVLGPWTVRSLVNAMGNRTDDDGVLMRSLVQQGLDPYIPWIIHGDEGKNLVSLEYAPSEADIANDTDIADEGDLDYTP